VVSWSCLPRGRRHPDPRGHHRVGRSRGAVHRILTDPKTEAPIKDLQIVAAVAAFSPDIPFSADNIEKNTQAMREMGVEIVESIEAMLPKVDAVMLLSIDGRPHLAQAAPRAGGREADVHRQARGGLAGRHRADL
jgi:hypothetical protein